MSRKTCMNEDVSMEDEERHSDSGLQELSYNSSLSKREFTQLSVESEHNFTKKRNN